VPSAAPWCPASEPSLKALARDLRAYDRAQAVDARYRAVLRELGAAQVEAVRVERQGVSAASHWKEVEKIEARAVAVRAEMELHGVKGLEQRIGDAMHRLNERGVTPAKLERMPEGVRAGITLGQLKAATRMMGQVMERERGREFER
jgi:hypothetical protein